MIIGESVPLSKFIPLLLQNLNYLWEFYEGFIKSGRTTISDAKLNFYGNDGGSLKIDFENGSYVYIRLNYLQKPEDVENVSKSITEAIKESNYVEVEEIKEE